MSNTMIVDLSHFAVLKISGSDATKFLQGQLSCDVNALQPGDSTLGAYCNIKGKVSSLFRLWRLGDAYYMRMTKGLAEPTLQELKKYAQFSKVELQNVSDHLHGFGIADLTLEINNEAQEIQDRIPELYPETINEFFAHDLNLPALGAVSFTKGCFRGQEIVARMQHRGNLKRHLQMFTINDADCVVKPGTLITNGNLSQEAVAGTVVRACRVSGDQVIGLAVISDVYLMESLTIQGNSYSISIN
jgi:folate-binding protein YgfZ